MIYSCAFQAGIYTRVRVANKYESIILNQIIRKVKRVSQESERGHIVVAWTGPSLNIKPATLPDTGATLINKMEDYSEPEESDQQLCESLPTGASQYQFNNMEVMKGYSKKIAPYVRARSLLRRATGNDGIISSIPGHLNNDIKIISSIPGHLSNNKTQNKKGRMMKSTHMPVKRHMT